MVRGFVVKWANREWGIYRGTYYKGNYKYNTNGVESGGTSASSTTTINQCGI